MLSIGLVGIAFSAPPIIKHYTISSNGTVHTVGINAYTDSNFTIPCVAIDWGWIDPGEEVTRTIYVFNEGNVPVTLSAVTQQWIPIEASAHLAFSWDKEGSLLDAGSGTACTLSLTVLLDVQNTGITNFSFDMVITGTQT